ncbi:MAG: DUF5615 family PIN-like protein [Phycisphaerae bacterium]|jgi:predicted nuclease of predicted toxin-antitoxin system
MNFLFDQDVYAATVRFVVALGHDAVPVARLGLAQAADAELLRAARNLGRILVTRDRDFGGLVFVEGQGPGVIYLRASPSTLNEVHTELRRVLTHYTEPELRRAFVVVEPGRHRIRHLGISREQGPP